MNSSTPTYLSITYLSNSLDQLSFEEADFFLKTKDKLFPDGNTQLLD